MLMSAAACAAAWVQPESKDPDRIVSLQEAVELQSITEPRRSPDGGRVAFLVKQRSLACDCTRTSLYVVSISGGHARKILETETLSNLHWLSNGEVTGLAALKGKPEIVLIDLNSSRMVPLRLGGDCNALEVGSRSARGGGVGEYRWSSDRTLLARTVTEAIPAPSPHPSFVYDDQTMSAADIEGPVQLRTRLEISRRSGNCAETIAAIEDLPRVGALSWSKDNDSLAFAVSRAEGSSLATLSLRTKRVDHHQTISGVVDQTAWLDRNNAVATLAYQIGPGTSQLDISDLSLGRRKTVIDTIGSGATSRIQSLPNEQSSVFLNASGIGARETAGLYAVDLTTGLVRKTPSAQRLADCDLADHDEAVCVAQTVSSPPALIAVNTRSGKTRSLWQSNLPMQGKALAKVRELRWTNDAGIETNGYLLTPRRAGPEKLPLVILGYGFDGEFAVQHENSNYPVQGLVEAGFAVLLFNPPQFPAWTSKTQDLGWRYLAEWPMDSLKNIVAQLSREGTIDSERVGIAGHSLSGFWAQLAAREQGFVKAVEIHNGGTASEPGSYWFFGSEGQRKLQEMLMGTAPVGEGLKRYADRSVSLNADKVTVPILIESNGSDAHRSLEYFSSLRAVNKPVELIVYPGEGHVYTRPSNRLASMQRIVDWFSFWLQNREDPDKAKSQQYRRWRAMRPLLATFRD
jgi:dipeptidyl aminopeptidase/acylaminoacyl peptidase